MTGADLQRWSREVAEDPGAPAFVPLARAYRKQGRRVAALSVVLRGLERDPQNVEGHALLALLHVDAGERERAGDEWDTILRLDSDNFDAHRGLGFLALERNDLERARTHLDAAATARPEDPAVRQAREVLGRRERRASDGRQPTSPGDRPHPATATRPTPTAPAEEAPGGRAEGAGVEARNAEPSGAAASAVEAPGAEAPSTEAPGATAPGAEAPGAVAPGAAREAAEPVDVPAASRSGEGRGNGRADPSRLFDALTREGPFVGALLLDERGLVMAGSMPEGRGEMLGAMVDSAIDEARRTARILELGSWAGVFLECDGASLHVAPLQKELVLVVAVSAGTPAGWLVRVAERARGLAVEFLEGV